MALTDEKDTLWVLTADTHNTHAVICDQFVMALTDEKDTLWVLTAHTRCYCLYVMVIYA